MDFAESRTKANLMKAFAGECQARTRYDLASEAFSEQQQGFISRMFAFTANQEKEHAGIFLDLLNKYKVSAADVGGADYPVPCFEDTAKYLRAAQTDEYNEYESVYPGFAETARSEGFEDIAVKFEQIAFIEKTHGDRFGCFAHLLERSAMFTGDDDTEWICLNCGHIFKGKNVPEKCPVCSHGQGFFVPYKYYDFSAERYTQNCKC